jgi:hypothetical protein
MSLLVPCLVAVIISITLIKLLIDFGQFKRFNSIFVDLGKKFLTPFSLPAQSRTLVNAFRVELLQVSTDVLNIDPDGLLAFHDRLMPNHPRWSKLIANFRLLTECLLFASEHLNTAEKLLTQRDYSGLVELFGNQRRQFDLSDGTHLAIVPARICYEIRDRIRAIRQELNIYESYGNCWPEDRPVVPPVGIAPVVPPANPTKEWPAQSPVYAAGNISPVYVAGNTSPSPSDLFQPNKVIYQSNHRINRSGSTRLSRANANSLRSGTNDIRIDDYLPIFGSDDKLDSFGVDDNSNGSDD